MAYRVSCSKGFGFIVYRHKGIIAKEAMRAAWQDILNHNEFTHNGYNVLADLREGTFDFSVEELDVIMDFLASIQRTLKGKRMAVIVDKPKETVISMLFEHPAHKQFGFRIKTFTTLEAGVEFARTSIASSLPTSLLSSQTPDKQK